eukprot:3880739-Prymnesium_polylepis.1
MLIASTCGHARRRTRLVAIWPSGMPPSGCPPLDLQMHPTPPLVRSSLRPRQPMQSGGRD